MYRKASEGNRRSLAEGIVARIIKRAPRHPALGASPSSPVNLALGYSGILHINCGLSSQSPADPTETCRTISTRQNAGNRVADARTRAKPVQVHNLSRAGGLLTRMGPKPNSPKAWFKSTSPAIGVLLG
ncbi:hypothetical protein AUP68_04569 [Ilyonectria robusta]